MSIRIIIALLLALLSGYILFQLQASLLTGINPTLAAILAILSIVLFSSSYLIAKKLTNNMGKRIVQLFILLAFIIPILSFFMQRSTTSNVNTPRKYIDTLEAQ
jgi:drug/metabolite transporter (DMT)-like permease